MAAQQQRLLMLVAVEELDDAMLYVSLLRNCRVDVMIEMLFITRKNLRSCLKKLKKVLICRIECEESLCLSFVQVRILEATMSELVW